MHHGRGTLVLNACVKFHQNRIQIKAGRVMKIILFFYNGDLDLDRRTLKCKHGHGNLGSERRCQVSPTLDKQ